MTLATAGTATHPPAGTDPAPARRDPAERGRLRIGPSVVRKVAEHAADLSPGTLRAPRTMAGIGMGSAGATVKVTFAAQRVDLLIELALHYPCTVRATVEQLRARVGDEVRRITGYQVRSIAVTVTALLPEPGSHLH